jgi:hypothetical protein
MILLFELFVLLMSQMICKLKSLEIFYRLPQNVLAKRNSVYWNHRTSAVAARRKRKLVILHNAYCLIKVSTSGAAFPHMERLPAASS